MKKNVLIKSILVLIVIALLTIGFTGCGGFYQTGTVYIWTDSYDDYDIYMDNSFQGHSYYTSSYFVIYNVPVGSHTFYADGWLWNGSKTQYIYSGTNNYVTIYTY